MALHARNTSGTSIRVGFARDHRYAAGVAIYAGRTREFAAGEHRLIDSPGDGQFQISPCRNDGVPCKELAMTLPEYDSGRNAIPAWH